MDPLFRELHSGLRHEAPGTPEDTLKALRLTGLSGPLRILDAGCGPGAASMTLLRALPQAHVTAIDLHQPFLDAARARAVADGVADRLTVLRADMAAPPSAEGGYDLVWSEGAIYALGVTEALRLWARRLAQGGRVAFSEMIWTDPGAPKAAQAFFAEEYPQMTDKREVLAQIESTGLTTLASFALGAPAWGAYYGPLAARVEEISTRHDPDHPVLAQARREIAMRQEHGQWYEYRFFVVAP